MFVYIALVSMYLIELKTNRTQSDETIDVRWRLEIEQIEHLIYCEFDNRTIEPIEQNRTKSYAIEPHRIRQLFGNRTFDRVFLLTIR